MAKKLILVSVVAALVVAATFYFYPREFTIVRHADLATSPLSSEEVHALTRIHIDCFADVYRKQQSSFYREKFDLRGPQLDKLEKQMDRIMSDYKESLKKKYQTMKNFYVVKHGSETIGEFSCQTDHDFTNGDPILYDVCLDKEQRGRGYGSRMTEYAIKACSKPNKPLVLTVYKDQDKLIKMYEGLGFKIVPFEKPFENTFKFYNKHLMRFTKIP
jgi:ribosomal protein S18 acetylase RimI-like enzyme